MTLEVGTRAGKLTLLEKRRSERLSAGKVRVQYLWRCKCDCGTVKEFRQDNIAAGMSRSCGCDRGRFKNRAMLELSNRSITKTTTEMAHVATKEQTQKQPCRSRQGS
jgi:hypothetical protein